MKPDEIKWTIAQFEGWRKCESVAGGYRNPKGEHSFELPDYTTSLDSLVDVWKKLDISIDLDLRKPSSQASYHDYNAGIFSGCFDIRNIEGSTIQLAASEATAKCILALVKS